LKVELKEKSLEESKLMKGHQTKNKDPNKENAKNYNFNENRSK